VNGALVVDKPLGPTSHDVVARVRRATGISRIGHTGTLDPLATGVLALVIGRATRLAQFLTVDEKEYLAGVRLGSATATYDAEERMVRDPDTGAVHLHPAGETASVPEAAVREALLAMTGTFWQTPPPFSAKKIEGTPAYLLARLQKPVEIKPVEVTVKALELADYAEGLVTLRVVSSSGFYVRSLAHDLGQRLGCGAHLESLRRLRAGEFTLDSAVPLDVIQREGAQALERMVPMSALLTRFPQVVVNERGAKRASHGNALAAGDFHEDGKPLPLEPAGPVRIVDPAGVLIAIGQETAGGLLQPAVVLV
jgi:tRNA pseudouridine55 synthase